MDILRDYQNSIQPNSICLGDCLQVMNYVENKSIDLILCDLPYNITFISWDSNVVLLDQLWQHYKRILKPKGVIVLTASQPYTTKLITSNPEMFKYELIWQKTKCGSFQLAKYMPLKMHENICIFYENKPTYNPQMTPASPETIARYNRKFNKSKVKDYNNINTGYYNNNLNKDITLKNPNSILSFKSVVKPIVPTQKPVELFEWLIKTYSNEDDLVLDNCMGSGTTAIACVNTKRNYICIEKDEKYFELAAKRISEHQKS